MNALFKVEGDHYFQGVDNFFKVKGVCSRIISPILNFACVFPYRSNNLEEVIDGETEDHNLK